MSDGTHEWVRKALAKVGPRATMDDAFRIGEEIIRKLRKKIEAADAIMAQISDENSEVDVEEVRAYDELPTE